MFSEAKSLSAAELYPGLSAEFERDVSEADILAFAENSGDFNPLHVNTVYAASTNYGNRIVHGAFQVGLASALIGMHLPGRNVLLGSIHARFPAPLSFPSRVRVRGELASWNPRDLSGRVHVTVLEVVAQLPTAEIDLTFTLHQEKNPQAVIHPEPARSTAPAGTRPLILVTGASGGIGAAIAQLLLNDGFRVLAQVNRNPLPSDLLKAGPIQVIKLDLSEPGWDTHLKQATDQSPLYGIVHAAWPGLPRGGLMTAARDTIEHQLYFGTTCLIGLAALLEARVNSGTGRLIAIGSTAGSQYPAITFAAYCLGKAALEHTVRLLAPELARKNITVNAVSPSFVPAGMNKTINDDRRLKLEQARVPLGRLCTPQDVFSTVRFLLTPEASFISGQSIYLTGAQLN
jgi:3-oxoacyl-[acyl-carrier protein] reductase